MHFGEITHIESTEIGEDCISKKELEDVKISGLATSCTKYIKPIKFTYDDEELTLCDCPGLEDTRGPELDIANIFGVVLAA